MTHNRPPENNENQQPNQQQSLGNIEMGDDNTVNVIQAEVVTLTQTKIIQISVETVKNQELITTSPYKGLKKFEPEDSQRFFGRDQLLAGLVNDLESTSILLLMGASGSGKSSVVRAGLIPWLQQKWGNQFVSLMFTPDRDPFESLYGSLLGRGYAQAQAQIARAGAVDTLEQVVNALKSPDEFWLIFIDQFEELFTVSEADRRDACIHGLAKLAQLARPAVKIVATMRADFLDRLSPYAKLVRLTNRYRPLMAEMQVDELRLAIEQPAAHHGVVFEPGLVAEIIHSVQGQAGCLSLLQYTLDLLWEREVADDGLQDRTLSKTSYRQLGGVRGALQQRVNQIFNDLAAGQKLSAGRLSTEQLAAQRIFLRLVEIGGDATSGTDWKPVRRRTPRLEFADETEQAVLTQLVDQNLLVSDAVVSAADAPTVSTVEIAHEILLTSWHQLHDWIETNRQAIALRNRLNDDVALWQAQKSDDELWSGSRLEQVLELSRDSNFNQVLGGFSPQAVEFINASEGKRDRQRRHTIAGLASFSGVALLLAGFAGFQWRQAEVGQIHSVAQASQAEFTVNRDTLEPLLEALRAGGKLQRLPFSGREGPLYDEVMEALTQSVFWVKELNRLEGHTDLVHGVSFSPDGQTLATASFDGTAKLWSPAGNQIAVLEGHDDGVTSVSFNPDGDLLVTTSFDQTARLWSTEGKEIAVLEGHDDWLWSASFSPDGQTIATASDDGTIRFWNLQGQPLPTVLQGKGGGISSVSFSPDGQTVAMANDNGSIELWDNTGTRLDTLKEHESYVLKVSFSPDGQTLASASADDSALLWNLNDLATESIKLVGHADSVNDIAFSPDGQYVLTASEDSTIKVWNRQGDLLETFNGHDGQVQGLSFQPVGSATPNQLVLASSGADQTIRFWQLGSGKGLVLGHHSASVYAARYSPDGQLIATADRGGQIIVWDQQGQKLRSISSLSDFPGSVNGIDFSSNGQLLAAASSGSVTHIWHWNEDRDPITLQGHAADVYDVSFSPSGSTLATASLDNTVKIWDLEGNVLAELQGHTGAVQEVTFSGDGQRLATASEDGTVKVWDQEGRILYSFEASPEAVYSVDFSPDSRIVAASSADNRARLWDLTKPNPEQPIAILQGHSAPVWSIAFSSDGQRVATASDDKTIKLWRKDGTLITTLSGHSQIVNTVDFKHDGTALVTGGNDRSVIIWDIEEISLEQLLIEGCNWVQDYLALKSDSASSQVLLLNFCSP